MIGNVTRPQLARIAQGDQALLRALELLFQQSGEVTRAEFEALQALAEGLEDGQGAGDARLVTGLPMQADYVDFSQGNYSIQSRRMGFDNAQGTVHLGLLGGYVQHLGQAVHYYAKNTSGATMAMGSAAMFTGTVGASGKLTFGFAVADGTQPPEYMMGIVAGSVADNAFGYVISFGLVRGFNTSGENKTVPETWADGDILYFDPAYAGELTNAQPIAPNLDLPIAVVVNAATGGSGSIFVRMKTGERLGDLHNVFADNPSDGAVLTYSDANGRWEATGGMSVMPADVVNANATANTLADATGLSFNVESGAAYRFDADIQYNAAATTTGCRFVIDGPSASLISVTSRYGLTATSETVNYVNGYNLPASSNASSPATTANFARIMGFVAASAAGTVVVRFASEVSGSAITALAGSTIRWQRVT